MAAEIDVLPVTAPAGDVSGPPQGQWTYEDYARLPSDGRRYDLLAGVLYMTPGAGDIHQVANNLFQTYLTIHVQFTGLGHVFGPPFDVQLGSRDTVQPDVVVVLRARASIITPRGIVGSPDLVVEIASPSTATFDRREKLLAYEQAGVREYWIADPYARTVEILVLRSGSYHSLGVFGGRATLPSTVVPGLPVQAHQFFGATPS